MNYFNPRMSPQFSMDYSEAHPRGLFGLMSRNHLPNVQTGGPGQMQAGLPPMGYDSSGINPGGGPLPMTGGGLSPQPFPSAGTGGYDAPMLQGFPQARTGGYDPGRPNMFPNAHTGGGLAPQPLFPTSSYGNGYRMNWGRLMGGRTY